VNLPGVVNKAFTLPDGEQRIYAYLPMMKATQHPLYHLSGTATLTLTAHASNRVLVRGIDLKHELLDEWNIAGPFAKGQAPNIAGAAVTAATLQKSYTGLGSKTVSWQTWQGAIRNQMYQRGADYLEMMKHWIDLYSIFPKDNAEAIAVTWVDAPRQVTARLRVRHKAGIAVWVNQESAMTSNDAQGIVDLTDAPPDTREIHLKKGWNQILVRTDDQKNDWGFSVRLALPPGVICAQSDTPPAQ
jgi:hypothetical protein